MSLLDPARSPESKATPDPVDRPGRLPDIATVGIGPPSEGGFGLEVALRVGLPGLDRADVERLVEAAHQVCPDPNAKRHNVDVQLAVA